MGKCVVCGKETYKVLFSDAIVKTPRASIKLKTVTGVIKIEIFYSETLHNTLN